MAAEKSRILVIGGTGYIGKHIVQAAARLGHPTHALVRDAAPFDAGKAAVLKSFADDGVTIVKGDLYDHDSLLKAIKGVDVVISAVGHSLIPEQTKLVAAIKEAGNIKRFIPSEFGNDVDRVHAVEPMKSVFAAKEQIRRHIEAEGVPYTYISSNFFAGRYLANLGQLGVSGPPTDKVTILGKGDTKAIFVSENDVATYTVNTVDDPRTLNKLLYVRPPGNILSYNEVVSLWEQKIGKTLERIYIPDEEVLKQIQEAPFPKNVLLGILHSAFVMGDQFNFEINPSFGLEATELYPHVKFTTADEYLDKLSQSLQVTREP